MKSKAMAVHLAPAVFVCFALLASGGFAASKTGQLEFAPAGKVEKLAGVWVDGAYVGYVSEIEVVLVPGEHQVTIRHAGYQDLTSTVSIQPDTVFTLPVRLERDPKIPVIAERDAEMRLMVKPNRAAVFLNGAFVGHVDEFDGPAQAMILPPGRYNLTISLPGYQSFETQVTLVATQKFTLKTELFPSR